MLKQLITFILVITLSLGAYTQDIVEGEAGSTIQLNTITTAVPFLLIAPDTRGGGLGDAGVATSPDGNSLHWNPAKLAFLQEMSGEKLKSDQPLLLLLQ